MKKLRLVSVQNCICSYSLGQQPPISDFVGCSLSELECLGHAGAVHVYKRGAISCDELRIVVIVYLDDITGRMCGPTWVTSQKTGYSTLSVRILGQLLLTDHFLGLKSWQLCLPEIQNHPSKKGMFSFHMSQFSKRLAL